ncbi:MAG: type II secretion system F family protein [Phycisphaerales bacterium]|nr:MAG: type II secretion system F family protein [Phycisphaerales bacterium]
MGQFSYKAVDRGGEHILGTIEAVDRRSAVVALAEKGQFVTELAEDVQQTGVSVAERLDLDVGKLFNFGSRRISSKDTLTMTTQLGTALRAGLPLLNCLELIRQQQHKTGMKEMFGRLVKSVSSGQSLSEAMSEQGSTFSPLYLSMIRVGETGGILDQTTGQLAEILGRDEKIKTSMKNASAYPIFVLCLGFVSVIIIVTWILPNILGTMSETAILPWPTRILMGASMFARGLFTTIHGWIVVLLILAGLYYLRRWTKSAGKVSWDSFKLKVPILGSVLRTIAVGRFARTLGALTQGGVTILEALGVVRDTLGNEVLGAEIDSVAEKVKRGESLAGPLGESGYFPPLLVQIVAIGEQTGKLDELLLNAAETFDSEADSAISKFMAIFPAILILLLALVVGFIIAAALLPIFVTQFSAAGL